MIDTAERAQERYEKNKKKPAPDGVSSFNAKTLYKAYLKRTGNVPTSAEEYEHMKATAPEFYRAADSMLYGVGYVPFSGICLELRSAFFAKTHLVGMMLLGSPLHRARDV